MVEAWSINDRIYGDFEISSPVLMELIGSRPLQRLKLINQFGIPDKYYHLKNFSRYEHTLGVMLLLQQLGASEEEQIAGLLHDVSHLAFSHIYDWVLDDHSKPGGYEDLQDKRHQDFITNTAVPSILEKYGYNISQVIHYHHFGLLERDVPQLCADRVDYSLRELPVDVAKSIFESLTTSEGVIICRDLDTALLFGKLFLDLQKNHWGGKEAVLRYHYFAKALRRGLNLGIILPEDFEVDDNYVLTKLERTTDTKIQIILAILQNRETPPATQGKVAFKKFRYIDPLFKNRDGLIRLSQESKEFKDLIEAARRENERGVLI